jgi:hypothetical protein
VSIIVASYSFPCGGTIGSCLYAFPRSPPSAQDNSCLSDFFMIKRGLSVSALRIGSLSESLQRRNLETMAFGFCIAQQYRPLYTQQHVPAALIVSSYSGNLTYSKCRSYPSSCLCLDDGIVYEPNKSYGEFGSECIVTSADLFF